MVFAAVAAVSLVRIGGEGTRVWLWSLLAAAGIQLRLLCNLMDGMLAVEGGLKTANGDLYNEFPDRLSDPLILAALGFAGGDELSRNLGWLCAVGALLTAAVRLHGASLTGRHDFCGPMAKPHRMALATAACLLLFTLDLTRSTWEVLPWVLGMMAVGIVITVVRRLLRLSRSLCERSS